MRLGITINSEYGLSFNFDCTIITIVIRSITIFIVIKNMAAKNASSSSSSLILAPSSSILPCITQPL